MSGQKTLINEGATTAQNQMESNHNSQTININSTMMREGRQQDFILHIINIKVAKQKNSRSMTIQTAYTCGLGGADLPLTEEHEFGERSDERKITCVTEKVECT